MIIPSFRLYHYAVKLIWKPVLLLTLLFWLGIVVLYYFLHAVFIGVDYGWWFPLMVAGTYFLLMDIKLMLMVMRHEEKKKWKRYKLNDKLR